MMNARSATSLVRCLGQRAGGGRLARSTAQVRGWGGVAESEAGASALGAQQCSAPSWINDSTSSTCSSSSSSCSVFRRWVSSSSSSSRAMAAEATPSQKNSAKWKTVTICASGKGTTMTAQCGKHQITTDQPVKLGGRDLGTDPMSMLLASLLGCEQQVVDLVAKDLHLDVHSVAYEVQGDYDPRGYWGDEDIPSHFQKVRIKASVITKESEDKLEELARVVQRRCPVSALFASAGINLQVKFVKV